MRIDWFSISKSDKQRTAVTSRKLVTGGKTDVQSDKLSASYDFGLATFDNAQGRHAYTINPIQLKFAK